MNYKDKQWLHEKYVAQEQTPTEIADECNSQPSTIINWLQEHEIPLRVESAYEKLHDREWLHRQYINEGKSGYDIADELDIARSRIYRQMERFDIERRSLSEAKCNGRTRLLHDKSWLRNKYVRQGKSKEAIARLCNCAWATVRRWLDKHDIEEPAQTQAKYPRLKDKSWIQEHYVEQDKSQREIAEMLDCSRSTVNKWINHHRFQTRYNTPDYDKLQDEQWLRTQYLEHGQTQQEIADSLGCNKQTVSRWMDEHDIVAQQNPAYR